METATIITSAREVVLSCVRGINEENFDAAREYVTDNMSFKGVLGTREGGDVYFSDMKNMKLKYYIKKVFADGDDVCLLYDLNMGGKVIFCCGWYHVVDGKIDSLRVVFDPRPVLDKG